MISFGNAASSHSGLIPLKTAYKKRGELLRAIASKKNFSNLHSASFVTVFARNLVHAYKFRIIQKTASYFFFIFIYINLKITRSISHFHDEIILLPRPESFRVLLSCAN